MGVGKCVDGVSGMQGWCSPGAGAGTDTESLCHVFLGRVLELSSATAGNESENVPCLNVVFSPADNISKETQNVMTLGEL